MAVKAVVVGAPARGRWRAAVVRERDRMPVYTGPGGRTPVTRKVGESWHTQEGKFHQANVKTGDEPSHWCSVSQAEYVPKDLAAAYKGKVMEQRSAYAPKPFSGVTTNASTYTVTAKDTEAVYSRPLRRAPSEIAMAKGSTFMRAAAQRQEPALVPIEMIRAEKERIRAIPKAVHIEPPAIRVNMPNYTGHEPKSPKNLSGPFKPTAATTSGHANLTGIGILLA